MEIELLNELKEFYGTENYYPSTFGRLQLTDGMHFLREKAECYWLIDVVESYQYKLSKEEFQIWTIKLTEDGGAIITCKEDTNAPILIKQVIPYTDFPLKEFEFYCVGGVVMLKGEY